jgi:hypothetical protein
VDEAEGIEFVFAEDGIPWLHFRVDLFAAYDSTLDQSMIASDLILGDYQAAFGVTIQCYRSPRKDQGAANPASLGNVNGLASEDDIGRVYA